jgi:hypothetical protein
MPTALVVDAYRHVRQPRSGATSEAWMVHDGLSPGQPTNSHLRAPLSSKACPVYQQRVGTKAPHQEM